MDDQTTCELLSNTLVDAFEVLGVDVDTPWLDCLVIYLRGVMTHIR